MTTYAIGDIQGCMEPLDRLLEHIAFDPGRDRLWLTGDLVNRGPDSLATLRFVHGLGESVVCVLGNHDLHLLALSESVARKRANQGLRAILRASDRDELLHWLRHRPLIHQDPALGFTLVHAGLHPEWSLTEALALGAEVEQQLHGDDYQRLLGAMYGDEPHHWSPTLVGMDRLRFAINCFTRLRFCDQSGQLNLNIKGVPEEAESRWLPWFRVPGRRSAGERIVFGHWSILGWVDDPGVVSLDTGCVWGGRLTAVRLEPDGVAGRWQVACPDDSALRRKLARSGEAAAPGLK